MNFQCEKIRYRTYLAAKQYLEFLQKKGRDEQSVYFCEDCRSWHLTKWVSKERSIDLLTLNKEIQMKIVRHGNEESTNVLFLQAVCSFPHVIEPELNNLNDNMEYTIDILYPKDQDTSALDAAIKQAIDAKWGAKVPSFKYPFLKDGDKNIDKKTGEVRGGYEGMNYISAKAFEDRPPAVVDAAKKPLTSKSAIVGGDIVNVFVNVYGWGPKGGNYGINFELITVMLKDKTDKPFGGGISRKAATDAFSEYDTDDDMVI